MLRRGAVLALTSAVLGFALGCGPAVDEPEPFCSRWSDCDDGYTCDILQSVCIRLPSACAPSDPCPSPFACAEGICVPPECEVEAQCPELYSDDGVLYQTCFQNICYPIDGPCTTHTDCPAGWGCYSGDCIEYERPCDADLDCAAGEECGIDFSCVAVPECAEDIDCRDGERCALGACVEAAECAVDDDCPSGEACDGGVCAPIAAACGGGDACAPGLVCVDDECIVPETSGCPNGDSDCSEDEMCLENECTAIPPGRCRADGDCEAGEVCRLTHCGPANVPCESDADCAETEYCSFGPHLCRATRMECGGSAPASASMESAFLIGDQAGSEGSCGASSGAERSVLISTLAGFSADTTYCADSAGSSVPTVVYVRAVECDATSETACAAGAADAGARVEFNTSIGDQYLFVDTESRSEVRISIRITEGPCP